MGYVVDIVNYDNLSWLPQRSYDVFIGHAGINFERICNRLAGSTVRIYYSTGIYWREANRREAQRLYDLAERRGFVLPPDRAITHSEEGANRAADGIIHLGNAEASRTFKGFPVVYAVNNCSTQVQWDGTLKKDYRPGLKNFLFFSGSGNVHKGLDLLLEAFAQTDLHLHICQGLEPSFRAVYRFELESCPNIHFHGRIPMRSPKFRELAASCNWVISATCAEGQPGAVIECMSHGLLPVLPDSANIDLDNWGLRLPDCGVISIQNTALQLSKMSDDECRNRAEAMLATVAVQYSSDAFRSAFKQAVTSIVITTGSSHRLSNPETDSALVGPEAVRPSRRLSESPLCTPVSNAVEKRQITGVDFDQKRTFSIFPMR
jgi:glycosyltransferase involved in cell wall biosynthesis